MSKRRSELIHELAHNSLYIGQPYSDYIRCKAMEKVELIARELNVLRFVIVEKTARLQYDSIGYAI